MPKNSTFSRDSGVFQSLLNVFGSLGATGISAVSMILISRTLGPVKFGEFSVGFSLLLILNKITDLGLTLTLLKFIPQTTEIKTQNELFSYTLKIKFMFSVVIACIGWLLTPLLSEFIGFDNRSILYLTFFFNIIIVVYEHLLVMLQSLQRFAESVLATAIQAISKFFFTLILIFFLPTHGLFAFITYMGAPFISLLFYKKLLPKSVRFAFTKLEPEQLQKVWKMAGHSAIGFIALGVIDNVDILFVQKHLNAFETGLLGGASRIAMLFSMAAYSLSTVLNSRVARYSLKSDLFAYLKKAFMLSVILIVGFLLILPFTKYAIILSIGSEYLAAVSILNILLAASFISVITVPLVAVFFSFKKAEWYFSASGVVQLILIILGNMLFVPEYGLEAAAWTRFVTKVVVLLFSLIVAAYYINSEHREAKD